MTSGGPGEPGRTTAARRGVLIAVACAAFAAGMVGAAYASVPLYRLFCQVTGYGGTTQWATTGSSRVVDRTVLVRFDSNVAPGLPWSFRPNEREVRLKLGETHQTTFHVRNDSARALTGQALFNVTPEAAGVYFNKVVCFCSTSQTLKPGEAADVPVLFFVDPQMVKAEELKDTPAITLSYTFFPVDDAEKLPEPVLEPVAGSPAGRTDVRKGRES
ncbi:cytochrome c oxidase assembly protein [Jiella sp. M17.18]|uniref:cytochrome c oxidase assembly protein n=1 Tax=Jiella sp. M17.18 TaxID=3234247 RepID=UPI0034DFD5EB